MGGKSRKSGGVSKKLIAHIKRGGMPVHTNKKTLKISDEKRRKNLFDEIEELGDYS